MKSLKADSPECFLNYKELRLTYRKKGELLKAISMLGKVLEYQDDNATKTILSYLYSEAGNMEKAMQYQVGDSTGRSLEETRFLYAMYEANVAFQRKDYSKAAEKYAKCDQHFEEYGGAEKYLVFYAAYAKYLVEILDTLAVKKPKFIEP